uniref:Apple domain-containing protein n=1 Tax=Meloidogyne floridensis TaxID=298350 RepID=A0A915NKS6_9BILA
MQHRNLQNYGNDEISIGMKRGLSLNECRCACANTWKLEEKTQCKSLHFGREEGSCELLNSDHSEKSDLVFNKSSDYHYTAEKMCKNKSNEHQTFNNEDVFNNNTATMSTETTNMLLKSELTTNKPEISSNKNSENSVTTNKPEFNLNKNSATTNKSEFNLNKPELNLNKNSGTTNKSEFNINKPEINLNKNSETTNKPELNLNKNINVQQTSTTTQTTTINAIIEVDKNNQQCFERISGFSMNGTTTASLEHNVSIEQCKCLCAN